MENEPTTASTVSRSVKAMQVYGMAALCLAAGLGIGYFSRGSQPAAIEAKPSTRATAPAAQGTAKLVPPPGHVRAMGSGRMPSLAEMKHMADRQAGPLLEQLKSDPNNSAVLTQLGTIYHTTHQFKEAAGYYGRAVAVDPRNVALRTKLASSLYRGGDVDGAITQLNRALTYDPKDANALFDLGMIRLQGKQDSKGALAAWQKLLKTNPQLSADRKAVVLKMMADVLTTQGDQHEVEGVGGNDGHK
jgi:Tetratricopeptide repeat